MSALLVEIIKLVTSSPWTILVAFMALIFYINYKTLTSHKERPESFKMVVDCLKEDKFGNLYRRFLGIMLDKASNWIGDKTAQKPQYVLDPKTGKPEITPYNRFFSKNPFTAPSYELLLRLAFVYPIFSFLLLWTLGGDGSVANIQWLDKVFADDPLNTRWQLLVFTFIFTIIILWLKQQRFKVQALFIGVASGIGLIVGFIEATVTLWVIFLSLFLSIYSSGWFTAWLWQRDRFKAHQLIYPFAFAITGMFTVAFAVAFTVAGAGASSGAVMVMVTVTVMVAFAFAFAGAFSFAFAVAVAGTVAFSFADMDMDMDVFVVAVTVVTVVTVAGAGILFIIQDGLQSLGQKKQKEGFFWLIYSLIFIAISTFLILNTTNSITGIFLSFYFLFPLLNAPIDWLSLGITRGLLQSIRHQHHGGWHAFAWALLDGVLAIFFLLLVSAVLVIAMGLVDSTLLQTTLAEINQENTAKNYYWVYAMLFTTLIPTLLHFALASSALTLWLPQTWRHRIANNLQDNHYKILAASTYLTITPVIGLLIPVALLYGLYHVLTLHGSWFGSMLLSWAKFLASSLQLLPIAS